MDTNELITPEQLAERWQIAVGTLESWRTARKGPKYVRLMGKRGKVRYRMADILEYEQSCEQGK